MLDGVRIVRITCFWVRFLCFSLFLPEAGKSDRLRPARIPAVKLTANLSTNLAFARRLLRIATLSATQARRT